MADTGTITIVANLVTPGGATPSGLSVIFGYQLQGATSFTPAGSAVTNASGVATSTAITVPAPGAYVANGTWVGNTSYGPSAGTSQPFLVAVATSIVVTVTGS